MLKKELTVFQSHLPLLHVLCSQSMRARHWKSVSETVRFDLQPSKHTNLLRVLDMGTHTHLQLHLHKNNNTHTHIVGTKNCMDDLLEIMESADKENVIEKSLGDMKDE